MEVCQISIFLIKARRVGKKEVLKSEHCPHFTFLSELKVSNTAPVGPPKHSTSREQICSAYVDCDGIGGVSGATIATIGQFI